MSAKRYPEEFKVEAVKQATAGFLVIRVSMGISHRPPLRGSTRSNAGSPR